jgi:hypothetical protein
MKRQNGWFSNSHEHIFRWMMKSNGMLLSLNYSYNGSCMFRDMTTGNQKYISKKNFMETGGKLFTETGRLSSIDKTGNSQNATIVKLGSTVRLRTHIILNFQFGLQVRIFFLLYIYNGIKLLSKQS